MLDYVGDCRLLDSLFSRGCCMLKIQSSISRSCMQIVLVGLLGRHIDDSPEQGYQNALYDNRPSSMLGTPIVDKGNKNDALCLHLL